MALRRRRLFWNLVLDSVLVFIRRISGSEQEPVERQLLNQIEHGFEYDNSGKLSLDISE
jgi:hypothetical protein